MTAAHNPDLVLLDIVLGDEDGRDVLRELQNDKRRSYDISHWSSLESERIGGAQARSRRLHVVEAFSLGEVSARIESVLGVLGELQAARD